MEEQYTTVKQHAVTQKLLRILSVLTFCSFRFITQLCSRGIRYDVFNPKTPPIRMKVCNAVYFRGMSLHLAILQLLTTIFCVSKLFTKSPSLIMNQSVSSIVKLQVLGIALRWVQDLSHTTAVKNYLLDETVRANKKSPFSRSVTTSD